MLRTSGGRGEYELAGSSGSTRVADVAGRPIFFSITSEITIPSRSRCLSANESQGKPRIRLESAGKSGEKHAYLVLRSLLMLPEPIRELSQTGHGPLVLENEKFSINAISVDVLSVAANSVVLRPTAIEYRNADNNREVMSVASRMARVLEIWRAAENSQSPLATLVRHHRNIVLNSPELHSALNAAATAIQKHFNTKRDYIESVANALGTTLPETIAMDDPLIVQPALPEDDPLSKVAARRRNMRIWRMQEVRGPDARAFSRAVRQAYDSRCAFSGVRLPKLPITYTPGVDAAHILPWRAYDLNHVSNGICLSKHFHWAFDNGIIRLDYLPITGRYTLSIPEVSLEAAHTGGMDLDPFLPFVGDVPADRFPTAASTRPNRKYLEQLNAELF